MIESRMFDPGFLDLLWEGQLVGTLTIRSHPGSLSLPGMNATADMQQRSTANPSNLLASEHLEGSSFDLSVPNTTLNSDHPEIRITVLDQLPLPKYTIFMAILESILDVSTPTPDAQLVDPVQVEPPPPYKARLRVQPVQTTYGSPHLTLGALADSIREIPREILLKGRGWSEATFDIMESGKLVASGSLSRIG